jgi:outer membrane protein assembly factor BamA
MVIAGRFGVAALFIASADPELDDFAQRFGPQPYRLRGGGANSNRGFLPGQLGDGVQGGLRRWEGSLELRIRLGQDFSLAFFGDVGDVHQGSSYRFDHLNTSLGFGLRYLTLVGPIRFDIGFRLPGLQRADGSDGIEEDADELPLIDYPGALHLTIGEAF